EADLLDERLVGLLTRRGGGEIGDGEPRGEGSVALAACAVAGRAVEHVERAREIDARLAAGRRAPRGILERRRLRVIGRRPLGERAGVFAAGREEGRAEERRKEVLHVSSFSASEAMRASPRSKSRPTMASIRV